MQCCLFQSLYAKQQATLCDLFLMHKLPFSSPRQTRNGSGFHKENNRGKGQQVQRRGQRVQCVMRRQGAKCVREWQSADSGTPFRLPSGPYSEKLECCRDSILQCKASNQLHRETGQEAVDSTKTHLFRVAELLAFTIPVAVQP